MRRVLVTGGAGFIGSALVRHLIADTDHEVLNVDALTYAGSLAALASVAQSPRYRFVRADICDGAAVAAAFAGFRPTVVVHLAAETHVDRSIDAPAAFVRSNVVGTSVLLAAALDYWRGLADAEQEAFRFHHVSTDEVFGALGPDGVFTEASRYDPRSPYSASKAGADHLVAAFHHSYGLPTLITNASNNYGPFQFPEKLIPLAIAKCRSGAPVPVYGRGANVRDWLHVEDHARALVAAFEQGMPGETYLVGARAERSNLAVVELICARLDALDPRPDGRSHAEGIAFVDDRPGHDFRYALDPSRIEQATGWRPRMGFEEGLDATIRWYLDNERWWRPLVDDRDAARRRGLAAAR